ncbi:MAG: protein-export chaperone SecB [Bosea sp. (in: a-proteobacteria)]
MANDATNGTAQQAAAPSLTALVQYVKDFSFENPNAPRVFGQQQQNPQIQLQVNVGAAQLSETDVESVLTLEGKAEIGSETLFVFELSYAGVFRVTGVPPEHMGAVVMIECPRLLFPFARQIVADAVRNGGFPPLYIDPVDFAALYQQRLAQEVQAGESAPVS